MKIEHPGAPTAAKLLRIPVSLVFAWAFAATAQSSSSNGAPGAQDETPPLLQRVQVTASLIKGSDKVGYNQVQSISAVDIQGSGYTTVGEFLSNAAANSASSWSENFDYGATGGAGIALRGLSEKYTLVLIDGQRAAPFAFPSNGTDTFVDLTSIPLNMVDHIEIVKTGAVAEYGSDAISGVVNIITKHNQHGLSLTAGFGDATQGHEDTERFSLAGGFGNLGANRYNISYSVDFFKQEGYTLADRSNTSNQDYSNRTFGVNTQGASYWEPGGVGNGGSVLSPCPYGGAVVSGSTILNGPSSGSACGANTASSISLHPDEERIVPKIHAQFNLGESTEGFVDLWGSHTTTRLLQGYNGIGDGVEAYDPQTGGITQVSNLVPASNPNNPYGTAVPLTYRFEGAPQITQANSNFFRISTGLDGQFTLPRLGDWDWAATLGHSQSLVHNTESGLLNVAALENILANGQFDFSNPNATPNGLAGLYASDQNQGASKLDSVDLTASTNDLYALPGGNIGMGIGAQFLHESDLVTEYPNQAGGLAIPYSLQAIDGERDVTAAYYQFDIPITTQLSLSQSGRYDHYSDFGDAFSPRYALRFQPVRMLTAYASYSRGFRAPTLEENSQSTTSGIQEAVDPYSPTYNPSNPQGNTYSVLVRGNPDLQPERTRNYNLGFQLSPDATSEIGFDWYKIAIQGVIGTGNMQTLVDTNAAGVVVRNANGTIAYVNMDYENLNQLTTDGFELTFNKTLPTAFGGFRLSGDWAYVWHFKQESGGQTVDFAGNDGALNTPYGASFPHWKGNLALAWKVNEFHSTLTYQYVGGYELTLEPGPGSVGSYSQFNLAESYTGFKKWTLSATIKNLLDRHPPYDPTWLEYPTATPYDPSLYTNEGRYIEVGATYHFL